MAIIILGSVSQHRTTTLPEPVKAPPLLLKSSPTIPPIPLFLKPCVLAPGMVDVYGGTEPFVVDPDALNPFKQAALYSSQSRVVASVVVEMTPDPVEDEIKKVESGDYSILDALKDYVVDRFPGKTLTLVHRTSLCTSYKVMAYDIDTSRAVLEGGERKMTLKPVITEREAALYYACWS